jgi:hypothetical protein
MDDNVRAALRTYGQFLDGPARRMDETIIQAIRIIREYLYLRGPNDDSTQRAIVTAKHKKMSGAELESLVKGSQVVRK